MKICLSVLIIAGSFLPAGYSQDYTQWRGPSRDGHLPAQLLPGSWPDSLTRLWQVDVGAGISTPLTSDDRIYLHTRSGDSEVVSAYSLSTAAPLWQQDYPAPFSPNSQAVRPGMFPRSRGMGPFATPLISGEFLFTLGVNRVVHCFNALDGNILWMRELMNPSVPDSIVYLCPPCNMECDNIVYREPGPCPDPDCPMSLSAQGFETTSTSTGPNYYGAVSSPMKADGMIIFQIGNAEQGRVIALDPVTGETFWHWDGPGVSSSSPITASFMGSEQIVTLNRTSINGLASRDGDPLWAFSIPTNAQIVTPVIYQNLIIFSTYRGPVTAIEIGYLNSRWSAQEAWQSAEHTLESSSPVVVGDRVFLFSYSNRGQFVCLSADNGETIWTSEGRQGRGASLQAAGGVIIALSDNAEMVVFAAEGDQYLEMHRYTVADQPVWAFPIFLENSVLIRDEASLSRWQIE